MDVVAYEKMVEELSLFKNEIPQEQWLFYCALGLGGESGEYLEKLKKNLRDHGGIISEDQRRLMLLELGDVFFYLVANAKRLGSNLEEVADMNRAKLLARRAAGTIKGSGDER